MRWFVDPFENFVPEFNVTKTCLGTRLIVGYLAHAIVAYNVVRCWLKYGCPKQELTRKRDL